MSLLLFFLYKSNFTITRNRNTINRLSFLPLLLLIFALSSFLFYSHSLFSVKSEPREDNFSPLSRSLTQFNRFKSIAASSTRVSARRQNRQDWLLRPAEEEVTLHSDELRKGLREKLQAAKARRAISETSSASSPPDPRTSEQRLQSSPHVSTSPDTDIEKIFSAKRKTLPLASTANTTPFNLQRTNGQNENSESAAPTKPSKTPKNKWPSLLDETDPRNKPSFTIYPTSRMKPELLEHHMALIVGVPSRNSPANLEHALSWFIQYIRGFLSSFGRPYTLYVIEQSEQHLSFNRGMLYNYGTLVANSSLHDYFCFQDIGVLPATAVDLYAFPGEGIATHWGRTYGTLHTCPTNVNKQLGAVVCMTREDFFHTSGWSNRFWGPGREDEEMHERLKRAGVMVREITENESMRGRMKRLWKCTPYEIPQAEVENWKEKDEEIRQLAVGKRTKEKDGVTETLAKAKLLSIEKLYGHHRAVVELERKT